MKIFSLFILLSACLSSACNKYNKTASDIPSCIRDEIKVSRNDPDWMVGSVEEYQFQNKLVYAFQPDEKRVKDGATVVKDANCTLLCHIGGFGGPSVNLCNGENFFKLAVLKRAIWKKK